MKLPLPSERSETEDAKTGARVVRWTASPQKDQHLYFTSPCVTSDDRWLVILSERTGHPNVFAIDRTSGEIWPLSNNRAGLLHAYVYPTGGERGLSKASPSMDSQSGRVVWVQDNALWMNVLPREEGEGFAEASRVLDLPPKTVTGFTHVSAGGRFACVPVAAEEAFRVPSKRQGEQMALAFKAFAEEGLESRVLVIDLELRETIDELAVPFWVTHVMFSASDTSRILFNQEGGDPVSQRIWRWQRSAKGLSSAEIGATPLYPQSAYEWMSHENFDPEGKFIITHGGFRGKQGTWFERRDWSGRLLARFPTGEINGQHAVMGTDGVTVLLDPAEDLWSWNMETAETRHLCRHGSTRKEQDCHVHPVMTPSRRGVVFTSDRDGVANVYEWREG